MSATGSTASHVVKHGDDAVVLIACQMGIHHVVEGQRVGLGWGPWSSQLEEEVLCILPIILSGAEAAQHCSSELLDQL